MADGDSVVFFQDGASSGGFVHGTHGPSVTVLATGDYRVTFSLTVSEPNRFCLVVNGVCADRTQHASDAPAQQNTSDAILSLSAGDILQIRNTTGNTVNLHAATGPTAPTVTASLVIERLDG